MLDQLILKELKQMDLTDITFLSVEVQAADVIRVVFDIAFKEIEFKVDDAYQVEILSITDSEGIHKDPTYFVQFGDIVFDVMMRVKLVEMKKRKEYDALLLTSMSQVPHQNVAEKARWDDLRKREQNLEKQEQELAVDEEKVRIFEILLQGEEHAISLQKNEEVQKLEAVRLKNRERLGNKIKERITRFQK